MFERGVDALARVIVARPLAVVASCVVAVCVLTGVASSMGFALDTGVKTFRTMNTDASNRELARMQVRKADWLYMKPLYVKPPPAPEAPPSPPSPPTPVGPVSHTGSADDARRTTHPPFCDCTFVFALAILSPTRAPPCGHKKKQVRRMPSRREHGRKDVAIDGSWDGGMVRRCKLTLA